MGSNIDPEHNLPRALERLTRLGKLVGVSAAYRNPAVGPKPQPDYLNAAALLEVESPATESGRQPRPSEPQQAAAIILAQLRQIEAELHRVRTQDKYASRTIDLDLLWLVDASGQSLTPPEPEILVHPHLAIPLAELAPDRNHPATGEELRELGERLRDGAELVRDEAVSAAMQALLNQPHGE